MSMNFEPNARTLAERIRKGNRGFLSLTREELRASFEIGRLTELQSDDIVLALEGCRMLTYPHPYAAESTIRVYDLDHAMGGVANAVLRPQSVTDGPLRRAAEALDRYRQDEDLRSEDVPWIEAFDLLLQIILGHGPHEWEDVRSGRHGRLLARELAEALGLAGDRVEEDWLIALASAVSTVRPVSRFRRATALSPDGGRENIERAEQILSHLQRYQERTASEHREILVAAARMVLGGKDLPQARVELGLLGLRRRRPAEEL